MVEDLNTLYYFTQVVEHRGFAAAGRALDIPKSKLSRRISQLEERLGVRLIHRTSRHCSLTEIGQEYYQRCLAMRVEAEGAAAVTQGYVVENPWKALAIVGLAGLVAGFLVDRLMSSPGQESADERQEKG